MLDRMLMELHELTARCMFDKPVDEPDFLGPCVARAQPERRSGTWISGAQDVPDEWRTELYRRVVEDR